MDKMIDRLGFDPYWIGLEDRFASLVVDSRNGVILMNEGDGEDRMNGAALFPDNSPRFRIEQGNGKLQLMLEYAGMNFPLGAVAADLDIRRWIVEVNRFLIDCIPLHARPRKSPEPLAAAG